MVLVTSYSTSPVKTIACSIGPAWLSTFVLLRKGMFFFFFVVCLHNSPSAHILVLSHFNYYYFFSKSSNPQLFIFNNVQVKLVFKPSFEMLVAISTALQPSNVHYTIIASFWYMKFTNYCFFQQQLYWPHVSSSKEKHDIDSIVTQAGYG